MTYTFTLRSIRRCLSVSMYMLLSVHVCVYVFACLSVSQWVCLAVCMSACPSVFQYVILFLYLSASTCLSSVVCLSVVFSVCLCMSASVCLSVGRSVRRCLLCLCRSVDRLSSCISFSMYVGLYVRLQCSSVYLPDYRLNKTSVKLIHDFSYIYILLLLAVS